MIHKKYRKKKSLLRQLNKIKNILYSRIGFTSRILLNKKISQVVAKERIKWKNTHNKKLENLRSNQSKFKFNTPQIRKNIIHNFSSYQLTTEEEYALSFSLDDNIPGKLSENRIKTEFERFCYHILKYTKDLDQNMQDQPKRKIRRTCKNYSQLKTLY